MIFNRLVRQMANCEPVMPNKILIRSRTVSRSITTVSPTHDQPCPMDIII